MDEPMGGRRLAPWLAGAVGLVVVALVVVLATRPSAGERDQASPIVGRAVPELQGTTLDGEPFDVDRLRGKWVVVNFFASWCIPCKVEHPELVAFSEAHRARGDAEVVGVVFSDDGQAVRAFFEEQGGDWPVIDGGDGRVALAFGVTGVPESYLVSPQGQVVAQFTGVTQQALDETITRLGGPA
jgi:cytochrome c biogenesis protein CcmG/thiol:disulfide interchange protein DsbE